MSEAFSAAAEALKQSNFVVAVTGAGHSVESGIADFRSAGGLWSRYPPGEYATYESFLADPEKVWIMWYELGEILANAKPNPGHYALAELEALGFLKGVITQNIDGLHQEAGNTAVIEYHGNAGSLVCPACQRRRGICLEQRKLGAPQCECGGYMKPDVVLFGEMIPPEAMFRSDALVQRCDVLLVVGTSAQVYPAAALPQTAKNHGATVIECNLEPTDFTHTITDIFIEGPSGETLPRIVELVKA